MQLVGSLLEHVHQLFTEGDPPLREVGLQRNQGGEVGNQGEPRPAHFDLAERGFVPCEYAQSCCVFEFGAGGALGLLAQLFVQQLEFQVELSEAL